MTSPASEASPVPPAHTAGATPPVRLREPANRLSPHAQRYWLARSGAVAVVLIGVQVAWLIHSAWGTANADSWHLPVLIVTGVLLIGYAAVMPPWRYRVHRWEVSPLAVYTQTGWLRTERRIAPLSRVQTVDLDTGAIARLFKLTKVTVTTASAAGPVVIDGLDAQVAADLVEQLTAVTAAHPGDAT